MFQCPDRTAFGVCLLFVFVFVFFFWGGGGSYESFVNRTYELSYPTPLLHPHALPWVRFRVWVGTGLGLALREGWVNTSPETWIDPENYSASLTKQTGYAPVGKSICFHDEGNEQSCTVGRQKNEIKNSKEFVFTILLSLSIN